MTRKDLSQYRSICAEIEDVKAEIHRHTVHSTVRGSDSAFPYLSHTVSVSGVPETKETGALADKLRRLEAKKRAIERYIDDVSDSLTRRILRYRYLDGLSWYRVAAKTGGGNTIESVRKRVYRYLREKK